MESCFYDSYYLEQLRGRIDFITCVKLVYDVKGCLPEGKIEFNSIINFLLSDVLDIDHSVLFDFDHINISKYEMRFLNPYIMVRLKFISSLDTSVMQSLVNIFDKGSNYFDTEMVAFQNDDEIIVITDDYYYETYLFIESLVELREKLNYRGGECG